MNLEDLIGEHGLQQDEWSLTAPTFGKDSQLQVVGWSGKSYGHKIYILNCKTCSQDSELFGEGYFRSIKSSLIRGQLPCGCSNVPQWSKEQYFVLCSRKARELGYKFIGFIPEWQGVHTKLNLLCEKHGEWGSAVIHSLVNNGHGCPRCGIEAIIQAVGEANTKPDDVMINSFFASGAFHPDTKFWRSERKSKSGSKPYWHVSCSECEEVGESFSGNLQQGQRPCACSKHRQQECYINWLIDDHNNTVAIKFGIARDSRQRIKKQSRLSTYALKQHSIYTFPDVDSCKKAEKDCRQELECGVVLKRDMPDGYTETTWAYNLDKIIEIYERNGGVLIV